MKCIVSEDISKEAYAELSKITKQIIPIRQFYPLYKAIRSHADIQCFPLEDNCVVVHPQIDKETIMLFKKYRIDVIFGQKKLDKDYPDNIGYNAVKVGDRVLHNFSFTDNTLKKEFASREYKFTQIKQGYAKCSVLTVDDRSIITSDQGIAKKVLACNLDVLSISSGSVELPGLNYGFIGGACGVIKNKGVVVFYGDITLHPDYDKIVAFLRERSMDYISLGQGKLVDIGSIYFIS